MTPTTAFQKLRTQYTNLAKHRELLQGLSSKGQRVSKQAIFAYQRGDVTSGARLMVEAEELFQEGLKIVRRESRLESEGIWRAALEEYCEAFLFQQAMLHKPLFPVPAVAQDPDIQLGGLSDCVGELVRQAVLRATEHDMQSVKEIHHLAQTIVDFLTSLDLTGGLRSKGDQARQHLRKLEDIRYDMSRKV